MTAALEQKFSALEGMKNFIRSTQGQESVWEFAWMSFQKELLGKPRYNPKYKRRKKYERDG